MNKLINIKNENGELVVSSRQVAEDFGKDHSKTIRDIENLIEGIAKNGDTYKTLFVTTQYQNEQNKQWYKEYLLTRDGFTLLAMGFTGQKALEFKLKYIQAFTKMEQELKEQQKPTCIEDVLIQSLQEMKDIKQQINEVNHSVLQASAKAEETKEEVQAMRDIITLNPNSWRRDSSALINKMAQNAGGYDHIKAIREESYKLLNTRLGVDIKTRLTNKRRRMADEGVCKSKRDNLTKLDVIADDKKLIEGYIAIVKEMSIKYKA
ncbi:Rha family transcriptional regulator [Clostridium algidicarnis]|uniref:Rha family transcriptional regulator n=1 Tax=Clostridium algidicarnis TaxID=37659 RepID=UPI003FD76B8B